MWRPKHQDPSKTMLIVIWMILLSPLGMLIAQTIHKTKLQKIAATPTILNQTHILQNTVVHRWFVLANTQKPPTGCTETPISVIGPIGCTETPIKVLLAWTSQRASHGQLLTPCPFGQNVDTEPFLFWRREVECAKGGGNCVRAHTHTAANYNIPAFEVLCGIFLPFAGSRPQSTIKIGFQWFCFMSFLENGHMSPKLLSFFLVPFGKGHTPPDPSL